MGFIQKQEEYIEQLERESSYCRVHIYLHWIFILNLLYIDIIKMFKF